MRNVTRYSEAFKLRLVEDAASGKYKSLNEAGRRNGIRGHATLAMWRKQYGREDMLPKRMNLPALKGGVSCKRCMSLRGSFCKEII
jgi:transposase-like protein